jgi:HPt (histidine-containing phosphotransfer) domain-containing protein
MRMLVERWGARAAAVEPLKTPSSAQTLLARANGSPDSKDDGPVDLDRLLEFTDGSPDNLRELITLYLEQTEGQLEQLQAAIRAGAAQDVRGIAHSCAGASATCGMRRLVPLLRDLERQGFEGKLTSAAQVCQEASREFQSIRSFLESYLTKQGELASQS